jgi:hypothetical protein
MPSVAAKPAHVDSVLAAIDRAPTGDPFPPEIRAELDRTMADIAAGRVQLVAHDDVPAWLEEHALREQGE